MILTKSQPADNKSTVESSAKGLIESLGPSQDYPDYEIPKELAPDGVEVVEDAQPDADMNVKTSSSSSASISSSTVLAVIVAAGGASLFFF